MKESTQRKVRDSFKSTGEFRTRKGIIHPELDPTMIDFICTHASSTDRILEIGGASGYFLDFALRNTVVGKAYNLDFAYENYREQANKNIRLVGGTTLELPFKDCSFEWVVMKNVLRHLVCKSRAESKRFARLAIQEVVRVTKSDGYFMVLEQYNNSTIYASITFYITLIFSLLRIKFERLGLYEGYVVSFLTPGEIEDILTAHNMEIIIKRKHRLSVPFIWRLTLLMSNTGRILLIGKVTK